MCGKCCEDFVIELRHLFFPALLSPEGQAFVATHGVDREALGALRHNAELLPDGRVKLFHRCQHLTGEQRCRIYADRPEICRTFDCATRADCTRAA